MVHFEFYNQMHNSSYCFLTDDFLPSVITSLEGKKSMMKLAQRMVNNFCASISTSHGHRWTTLSGMNEVGVRVTVHKSMDPGQSNGVVLSAATTIWLPVSPQTIFNFFKNDRTRSQVFVTQSFTHGQTFYNGFINSKSLIDAPSVGCSLGWQSSSRGCSYSQRIPSRELHICS